MEYSHRYPAYPTQQVVGELERHIDIHRQAYNYTRYEYENVDADDIGSAYRHHYRLPGWKDEFPAFSEINSKALQRTVTRFYQNLDGLSEKKQNGRKVEKLDWKSPREFQSITYSQSGFELKNTSGRRATLWLSKIGDIHPLPPRNPMKQTSKKSQSKKRRLVSGSSPSGWNPTTQTCPRNPPWTRWTRVAQTLMERTRVEQLREATS
nr:hypothetical protein [Natronomonas moolapensis]